jgi:hypothetical protein
MASARRAMDTALLEIPGLGRLPTGSVAGRPAATAGAALWHGLALTAVGARRESGRLIRALDALRRRHGPDAAAVRPDGTPCGSGLRIGDVFALLCARHALAAGDHAFAVTCLPAMLDAIAHGPAPVPRAAALRTADVAESVGDAHAAATLRRAAATAAAAATRSRDPAADALLGSDEPRAGVPGDPLPPPRLADGTVASEFAAAGAALAAGEIEPALGRLLTDCADGPEPAAAAAAVYGLAGGLLGLEADGFRHRLRVRPALGPGWTLLEVGPIHVGDAEVRLRITAGAGGIRIVATPEAGAVPVRLILEPRLPQRDARLSARVDGQPADLQATPLGRLMAVPVQLALDAPRVLEIRFDGC